MHHTDEGNVIVASFSDRGGADTAVRALHDEGFRRTWLAVIGRGGTGGDNGGPVDEDSPRRWFRGDAGQSLYDALRGRGVADDVALQVDDTIVEGNCVLVAEGSNDPTYAEEIVAREGGALLSAPTPLLGENDRDALRERRTSIAPVVREDVFICREPRVLDPKA
jgi:hypothetical protein